VFEQPEEQGALGSLSRALPKVEARPRRERHEVQAVLIELSKLQREKRDARREAEVVSPGDVEAADILGSNVGVGTDVNDVDSLYTFVLKAVDRASDESAGNECLAESDLIGNEETIYWLPVFIQALEDVVDRPPLKVLKASHH
jgi:hypothetical protein